MGARRHDVTALRWAARGLLAAALLHAALPASAETKENKRSPAPNRFGAIAYDRAVPSWGVGYNHARARDANVEALKQCGHGKCEVVHKFKNGCAALADGPKVHFAASGATRSEAETKTLRRCAEVNRGASCNLIAWGCTR